MKRGIKIIIIVLVALVVILLITFGIPCGTTCKGFCKCHGIPLGKDKCIGYRTYGCCVDCGIRPTGECIFEEEIENCNTNCTRDSNCKFELGYCVNIHEKVFLPENVEPLYEELVCSCENSKCIGKKTGRIAI